jgi:hypothetical protein
MIGSRPYYKVAVVVDILRAFLHYLLFSTIHTSENILAIEILRFWMNQDVELETGRKADKSRSVKMLQIFFLTFL